jgi:hypothetical protein
MNQALFASHTESWNARFSGDLFQRAFGDFVVARAGHSLPGARRGLGELGIGCVFRERECKRDEGIRDDGAGTICAERNFTVRGR